jgi:hypothetical protein
MIHLNSSRVNSINSTMSPLNLNGSLPISGYRGHGINNLLKFLTLRFLLHLVEVILSILKNVSVNLLKLEQRKIMIKLDICWKLLFNAIKCFVFCYWILPTFGTQMERSNQVSMALRQYLYIKIFWDVDIFCLALNLHTWVQMV